MKQNNLKNLYYTISIGFMLHCFADDIGFGEKNMEGVAENPVVSRYVQALCDVAKKDNIEHDVPEVLSAVCELIEAQSDYPRALARYSLMPKEAAEFVDMLAEAVDCPTIILNFLKLLARNKRFSLLPQISQGYQDYLKEIEGTKTVFVTYADRFGENEQKKLLKDLKEVFGCDNVECVLQQDRSLIGGIQVRYKSKMLDYSVKSMLARLHETIRRGSYAN